MPMNFDLPVVKQLAELVKHPEYEIRTGDNSLYEVFDTLYPLDAIKRLTLERYCLGTGYERGSFCHWLEFKLKPVLGGFSAGQARNHLIYQRDGQYVVTQPLRGVALVTALREVLAIHYVVASASVKEDFSWLDDNARIRQMAGNQTAISMGPARKLRLLAAYHPDEVPHLYSSDHISHFLNVLGVDPAQLPAKGKPIARFRVLQQCYQTLKEQYNPKLTPHGFAKALYSDELGIHPQKESEMDSEYIEALDSQYEPGLNQILYGPPGTGKTFATASMAVKIADPEWYRAHYDDYKLDWEGFYPLVKARYDALVQEGRVAFSTFHQSYAYEDFVEGIRANSKEGKIAYGNEPGVFKSLVDEAYSATAGVEALGVSASPKVWKISIGRKHESDLRKLCLDAGQARIGWNNMGDLDNDLLARSDQQIAAWEALSPTNQNTLASFYGGVKTGDILLCLKDNSTIQAVGVVTSDYYFDEAYQEQGHRYAHVRDVGWLVRDVSIDIRALNDDKSLVQKTLYRLYRMNWHDVLQLLRENGHDLLPETPQARPNYVMIIDEINRGNVSRIFGELITLLERDKRIGGADAREVTLPYSKERFAVPDNVYVVGTMNTADRSLAQLDLALRRRFDFIEMEPRPQLLESIQIHEVDLVEMLTVMNQRIEVLLDRDHMIGHAYFMRLWQLEKPEALQDELAAIFKRQIIPLLQEYFFDDWQRIGWVLNDHRKAEQDRFIRMESDESARSLFGDEVGNQLNDRRAWVDESSFTNPKAYQGILSAS